MNKDDFNKKRKFANDKSKKNFGNKRPERKFEKKNFGKRSFEKGPINKELLKRYDKFFGENASKKIIDAKKYSRDEYIRVNSSKTTIEEVENFLNRNRITHSKTFLDNAIRIERSHFSLASSLLALTGDIYIQDLASQIPVKCIDFSKYEGKKIRVLDCCAAPGSKTTQLADELTNNNIEYELIALEPEEKRLTRLINNIQKQNLKNIIVINSKAQDYKDSKKFDIIVVDAPCSGNLIFDRDWLNKRDMKGINGRAQEQRKILENMSKMVSKGGKLIYSTCSIEPEENEENVKWFEDKFDFTSFTPKLKFPFETKPIIKQNSIRLLPYLTKTQGFFVCCFEKK